MVLLSSTTPMIYPELLDSQAALLERAQKLLMEVISDTLEKQKECRLGLAGGTTPLALYQFLAQQKLPWERIRFIQLDERQVPVSDPESNLGALKKALFEPAQIPAENILAFNTELPADVAAEAMSTALIDLTHERFPLFDLLILGAGADGHIASLFEGDATLQGSYYASPARAKGYPTEKRLTLTLLPLLSAEKALILLKGEEKKALFDQLAAQPAAELPSALAKLTEKVPTEVLWCA